MPTVCRLVNQESNAGKGTIVIGETNRMLRLAYDAVLKSLRITCWLLPIVFCAGLVPTSGQTAALDIVRVEGVLQSRSL